MVISRLCINLILKIPTSMITKILTGNAWTPCIIILHCCINLANKFLSGAWERGMFINLLILYSEIINYHQKELKLTAGVWKLAVIREKYFPNNTVFVKTFLKDYWNTLLLQGHAFNYQLPLCDVCTIV